MHQSPREFAKRSFGQNFLVNPAMQRKITDKFRELVIEYDPSYEIVEIGPGLGDLSQYFFDFGGRFTMLEIDKRSVEYIRDNFDIKEVNLVLADAYAELGVGSNIYPDKFVLFSNLPFNVGSRIMVDLAIYYPNTPFGVILQKEVASKIRPDSDFTFFGAWLELFWNLQVCFDVSKGNFSPMPKVTSSYIQGKPKQTNWDLEQRKKAKEILKLLFAMPSKTIVNNLRNIGWGNERINEFFDKFGLDKNTRLNWNNYKEILVNILEYEK